MHTIMDMNAALLAERTNYIKTARDNYQLFYDKIDKLEKGIAEALRISQLGNFSQVIDILERLQGKK